MWSNYAIAYLCLLCVLALFLGLEAWNTGELLETVQNNYLLIGSYCGSWLVVFLGIYLYGDQVFMMRLTPSPAYR